MRRARTVDDRGEERDAGGDLILMASDTRKRLGELVSVENTSRRRNSADNYLAVYVQVDDEVVSMMMTQRECDMALDRGKTNPEDMPGYRKRFMERFRR